MNHMNLAGGPRPFDYLRYETGLLRRCRGFFDRYLDFAHDLPQSGIWAAYSQFDEQQRGSIEVGKWADFVVVGKNITTMYQPELPQVSVERTYVRGKRVK